MTQDAARIAVLAHSDDRFWDQPRLIHLLMARWREMGFETTVVTDPENPVPADAAIQHVSLSLVPAAYRRLAEHYPKTLNAAVVDIRKRRFSHLLVARGEAWDGPVIVKTDWNAGGWRELRGSAWSRFSRVQGMLPWRWRRFLDATAYAVHPSVDRVPAGVWRNPRLVVERFVPERVGNRYLCRHWLFLGTREVFRRTLSREPVVKFRGLMESTSDGVPPELRRLRAELGFDYGKFDYGMVAGHAVLYDVNRTPGAAADARVHAETVDVLAPGIRDFLPA